MRPFSSSTVEPYRIREPSTSDLTAPTANVKTEVTVTNSIKPHSSTIRLDPLVSSTLRLDPLNTSTFHLDPHSSSMLRSDPLRTSLPSLEPTSLTSSSYLNSRSASTPSLDPLYLRQDPPGYSGARPEPQSSGQVLSYPKPFTAPPVVDTSPKLKETPNHQNGTPIVVPLPDPPPNSCLKTGNHTNHRDSRSGSRVGLRVHFKLPEDEEDERSDASSPSDEYDAQALLSKEPPPVLAKPKL